MKLLTHCNNCLRDLRDLDCDDNLCPICDADIVDWDNYDGPTHEADMGDWRAECRAINAEQARRGR